MGKLLQSQSRTDEAVSWYEKAAAQENTGAAYRLKSGVQVEEFSEAVKENVLAKQWMCGMPDTMVVIDVDGQYVLTAYGADELIETFKTNALSALDGAKVVLDAPVVENGF